MPQQSPPPPPPKSMKLLAAHGKTKRFQQPFTVQLQYTRGYTISSKNMTVTQHYCTKRDVTSRHFRTA
jgi:hypothetical protein